MVETLPVGFELPDVRTMSKHVTAAHRRWEGQKPQMPAISVHNYPHHHRRQVVLGRVVAAGIAAADIDPMEPVPQILARIGDSLEANGCAALPIREIDPCGFLNAGDVWELDFSDGHPHIRSVKV